MPRSERGPLPEGSLGGSVTARSVSTPGDILAAVTAATETLPVTAAVPTIGRVELLEECVRTILACHPAPAEILLVDQSGGTEVQAAMRALAPASGSPAVRVVSSPVRGIALAMNTCLKEAAHDRVLITNDDCTVAKDWVAHAWRHLEARPDGIVTGRVLPGGEGAWVPSLRDEPQPRDFTGELHFGALYAGNMGVDRRLALENGGFDERRTFAISASDNDFGYRWLRAKRPMVYEPLMTVWHHDWRTNEQLEKRWVEYARGQGAVYAKHIHAGDRWILKRVATDMREAAKAELKGLVKRRPRHEDERRAGLYYLPVGLFLGWRESRRIGASPSSRAR